MIDKVIDSKVELSNYGQGFQRNLIYTLIKLSTKYIDHTPNISEEFAPNLTVIAFEEPEAFLHISQQETMNYNLEQLSCADNMQVVVTSHSTTFASRNIKDFDKIIRLDKSKGRNIYNSNLSHRAKSVYMYLKDRADSEGRCWPAIRTIALELGLSRSTVKRALDDLCRAGLLQKDPRWRENGSLTSNLYHVV